MTYEEAVIIGRGVGLEHDFEFVNNVIYYCDLLFKEDTWREELEELVKTAYEAGVKFSKVCGHAIPHEDSEDEICYTCKKLNNLRSG